MPLMTTLRVSSAFKAKTAEEKELLAAAKARGPFDCDHTTALDNIRLSGGLYEIAPEAAAPEVTLEEMPSDRLLTMALGLGMKVEGQVKRGDLIAHIREAMQGITVQDGDA